MRFNGSFKPTLGELTMRLVWVVRLKLGSSRYPSTTVRASPENVTSRLYNRSLIIPCHLACKTFANLLIYLESIASLETQKEVMSFL